jgi:hypothetical protein
MSDFRSAAECLAAADAEDDQLLDALRASFGGKPFDVTSVRIMAKRDPQLAAVLNAAGAPKYRAGYWRRHRSVPLTRLLKSMAHQHFDTDEVGYWRLKVRNPEPV